jgi:C4-dicarboxylate-specific signal transduction histidine kinase
VTTSPWLGRLTAWIRPAGPAAGRIGSIALTRWFAAVGALAIGLFSLAMGWQVSSYLAVPGTATAPSVVEFFAHVAAMPDVLRANVYAPDRRLVRSSRQELIGQRFGANDELDEALRGRVVVHRADDDGRGTKDEHLGLAARRTPYVEDYLPVYDDQGRGPIGVVELYRQPVALYQAIQEGQWRIRLGALLGGLFLFAVLVWFVRHTERALQDRERRLVEAETLAVAGELSAAVAHSIRNPLGSIRSGAELQRELHGDQQGVHAETIQHVDRIEHLVRTLLAYAGDGQDRQARADLAEVLQSAAARFAPDLRALIELQDSGSGIAAERLDDVFKPFFTTKPRGLGLGLPLARRIVRRLGGELRIESSPGCGTRVAIELPVVDP